MTLPILSSSLWRVHVVAGAGELNLSVVEPVVLEPHLNELQITIASKSRAAMKYTWSAICMKGSTSVTCASLMRFLSLTFFRHTLP